MDCLWHGFGRGGKGVGENQVERETERELENKRRGFLDGACNWTRQGGVGNRWVKFLTGFLVAWITGRAFVPSRWEPRDGRSGFFGNRGRLHLLRIELAALVSHTIACEG